MSCCSHCCASHQPSFYWLCKISALQLHLHSQFKARMTGLHMQSTRELEFLLGAVPQIGSMLQQLGLLLVLLVRLLLLLGS